MWMALNTIATIQTTAWVPRRLSCIVRNMAPRNSISSLSPAMKPTTNTQAINSTIEWMSSNCLVTSAAWSSLARIHCSMPLIQEGSDIASLAFTSQFMAGSERTKKAITTAIAVQLGARSRHIT